MNMTFELEFIVIKIDLGPAGCLTSQLYREYYTTLNPGGKLRKAISEDGALVQWCSETDYRRVLISQVSTAADREALNHQNYFHLERKVRRT